MATTSDGNKGDPPDPPHAHHTNTTPSSTFPSAHRSKNDSILTNTDQDLLHNNSDQAHDTLSQTDMEFYDTSSDHSLTIDAISAPDTDTSMIDTNDGNTYNDDDTGNGNGTGDGRDNTSNDDDDDQTATKFENNTANNNNTSSIPGQYARLSYNQTD